MNLRRTRPPRNSTAPRTDLDLARRFLQRLDPEATAFAFQTWTNAEPKPAPDPRAETRAPRGEGVFAAFLLGGVMMLTNFTSLVLYIPAMKDIHRSPASDATKAVVVLVAFLVTSLPALVP